MNSKQEIIDRLKKLRLQVDEYNADIDHYNRMHPNERKIPRVTFDEIMREAGERRGSFAEEKTK